MSFYNIAKNKRKQPTPETSSLPRKLLFPSFSACSALPQIEREQQPSENERYASDGRDGSQHFDPCYGECIQTSRKTIMPINNNLAAQRSLADSPSCPAVSPMISKPRAWIMWYCTPVSYTAMASAPTNSFSICAPNAPMATDSIVNTAPTVIHLRCMFFSPLDSVFPLSLCTMFIVTKCRGICQLRRMTPFISSRHGWGLISYTCCMHTKPWFLSLIMEKL